MKVGYLKKSSISKRLLGSKQVVSTSRKAPELRALVAEVTLEDAILLMVALQSCTHALDAWIPRYALKL